MRTNREIIEELRARLFEDGKVEESLALKEMLEFVEKLQGKPENLQMLLFIFEMELDKAVAALVNMLKIDDVRFSEIKPLLLSVVPVFEQIDEKMKGFVDASEVDKR